LSFFIPGTIQKATTDFVSMKFDTISTSGNVLIEGFNSDGKSVGKASASDKSGSVSLSVSEIHSIRISQDSATVGFDDLMFNPLSPVSPISAIPEPATAATMVLGLVAVLASARRRANSSD